MKLGLFVLSTFLFFKALEFLFDLPELNFLVVIGLGIGIYLLGDHPLVSWGFPQPVEIGIAAILIVGFILHFGFVVTVPALKAQDEDNEPCSARSIEGQCYNLSQPACLSAWQHYKSECKAEAESLSRGATQLVGAGIKKCVQKKFVRYMSYNQRNENSDLCREYFSSLNQ